MLYNNCVNIGVDENGLRIAVLVLLRVGHAPLQIPWSEIQVVRGDSGLIFKKQKLLLGREEMIPLFISPVLAKEIKEVAGQHWPVEIVGA